MILLAHLLFGAIVAKNIVYIPLAIVLAYLSHYFLDLIPHTEYSIKNIRSKEWQKSLPEFLKALLDSSIAAILILLLSGGNYLILIISLFAIVPDGFEFIALFFSNKFLEKHSQFHQKIHFFKHKKISNFWRILSQILIIIFCIILLKS